MNVFIISPGRTATTTLAHIFTEIDGYTSSHESLVSCIGKERIKYPEYHIELDNRLTWFLPRLTKKYGENALLVIVYRNKEDIAKSYNKRWYKINIMKAYSQGILLRDLNDNNLEVCLDYVKNVYEQLEYFAKDWKYTLNLDLENPEEGILEILKIINREDFFDKIILKLNSERLNENPRGIKHKLTNFRFNLKALISDLKY